MMSDNAAPNPVIKPSHLPLLSVRCMHSIPMGPMGADTKTPIKKPLLTNPSI